jgi:hypothetical protein
MARTSECQSKKLYVKTNLFNNSFSIKFSLQRYAACALCLIFDALQLFTRESPAEAGLSFLAFY